MNLLTTDGYKFSMAQAGFPLRQETFYFSFRKGGWQYIPWDLEAKIRELLPNLKRNFSSSEDFLAASGYGLSAAMIEALRSDVTIKAAPKGTWVYEREPIVTISGPSFLVSWLEPLVLRLFFPIQFATQIMKDQVLDGMFHATCKEQVTFMEDVLAALPKNTSQYASQIKVGKNEYFQSARSQIQKLLDIVKDPNRIFEVGMRAATCNEQHTVVLTALFEAGVMATSNVLLAHDFQIKAVGTMGHEHVQRWGNDLDAYRAMRDTRTGAPSYLLDTFDTITSGIPAAVRVMKEREHPCSIRYDSGDKFGQYIYAHGEFQRHGLEPMHIIEDGLDAEMTAKFEKLREHTGLAPEKQIYGYGGFLVSRHWKNPLTRDRVAAVYKLTQTSGEPRMKFGNESGLGKVSIPGHPVAWRRLRGAGPMSIIGQYGETPPEDFVVLTGGGENAVNQIKLCRAGPEPHAESKQPYVLSPETQRLVKKLEK